MDIIFQGIHTEQEAVSSLQGMIHLLKDRYHIEQFNEMHLTLTLMDNEGHELELVDNQTNQVYRIFEVYRQQQLDQRRLTSITPSKSPSTKKKPKLTLVNSPRATP